MSERPIDLAALRDGTVALRALARAYPDLTTPASGARLARWLEEQEATPVRKLDDSGSVQINFRAPSALAASLEVERVRLSAATPGLVLSASDVVRVLLARALTLAPATPPTPKPTPPAIAPAPARAPKAKAPKADDLRARYQAHRELGHTVASVARAVGLSDGSLLSRWVRGGKISDALASKIAAHIGAP